jgi:nucleotide-binding universal stress UspA family protein
MRRVLVAIDGSDASRPALETAFQMGRLLEAHVVGLHVRIEPAAAAVPLVGEGMSGILLQDLIDLTERQSAARAAAARTAFEETRTRYGFALATTPGGAGPSAEYLECVGREDEEAVGQARLADLVVLARPGDEPDIGSRAVFHAVLFEGGSPVLVAAPRPRPKPLGRVVVAWNKSAEAARALKASLPLLRLAEQVTIVAVTGEEGGDDPCAAAVAYLGWQGITAHGRRTVGPDATGEALVDVCGDADLVVMGAYTHSRLWQVILGGVTRHMLEKTPLPLLMAH